MSTLRGSVAKFDFWGKIQKLGIRNSMTYRLPKSRKSDFATEPHGVSVPLRPPVLAAPQRGLRACGLHTLLI